MDVAQLAREFGTTGALIIFLLPSLALVVGAYALWLRARAHRVKVEADARARILEAEASLKSIERETVVRKENAEVETRRLVDDIALSQLQYRQRMEERYDTMTSQYTEMAVKFARLEGIHEASQKGFNEIREYLLRNLDVTEKAWKAAEARNVENMQRLEKLQKEVDALKTDLARATSHQQRVDAENATLRSDNTRLESENKEMLDRIAELENRLKLAEDKNKSLEEEIIGLRSRIDVLQIRLHPEVKPEPVNSESPVPTV